MLNLTLATQLATLVAALFAALGFAWSVWSHFDKRR